jgi:hypothetical protein
MSLPLTPALSPPQERGEGATEAAAALCINLIRTRPRSGTVTTWPRSAARLRRFNIVGRSRSNRAPVCWSR